MGLCGVVIYCNTPIKHRGASKYCKLSALTRKVAFGCAGLVSLRKQLNPEDYLSFVMLWPQATDMKIQPSILGQTCGMNLGGFLHRSRKRHSKERGIKFERPLCARKSYGFCCTDTLLPSSQRAFTYFQCPQTKQTYSKSSPLSSKIDEFCLASWNSL